MVRQSGVTIGPWIGLKGDHWSDESEQSYSNHIIYDLRSEHDCSATGHGIWIQFDCSEKRPYICKRRMFKCPKCDCEEPDVWIALAQEGEQGYQFGTFRSQMDTSTTKKLALKIDTNWQP